MPKIVNTALKAKAKAWTFEAKAKAKATGPEAKAKVKAIKLASRRLEAKAWPRGLHHCTYHFLCDGLGSTGSLSHFIDMFIHLCVWFLCGK